MGWEKGEEWGESRKMTFYAIQQTPTNFLDEWHTDNNNQSSCEVQENPQNDSYTHANNEYGFLGCDLIMLMFFRLHLDRLREPQYWAVLWSN